MIKTGMLLCKSNGWILEQKNNYRKCYKAAKFSLSDARMEYSVVELRRNYFKAGGLLTILVSFLSTVTSNVNPSITNGVIGINFQNYITLTTIVLVVAMFILYLITMWFDYKLKKHKNYYLVPYFFLSVVVLLLTIGIETSNALIAIMIFIFSLLAFLLPIVYFIYHKIIDYDARLIALDEIIEALENK